MKIINYILLINLSLFFLSCSDDGEQIDDNQGNTNNSYVTWNGDLLNFEKSDGLCEDLGKVTRENLPSF